MSNHFEMFPGHSPEKPVLFLDIYEKLRKAPEDSKKFEADGLSISPDGYVVSIKKQSPAYELYKKIIEVGEDAHYELNEGKPNDVFYVFTQKSETGKEENRYDLAA